MGKMLVIMSCLVALFAVTATEAQNGKAETPQGSVRSKAGALATAEPETKQLLLLMDKDKNGKVSKNEFMDFMAAEFDRLDVNKDGELDVKELTGLRVRPNLGK